MAPLGASCATPIGVHARVDGERLALEAFVGLPDGSEWLRDRLEADAAEPVGAGAALAERLRRRRRRASSSPARRGSSA